MRTMTEPTTINDDGAWCWFQDPRALALDDRVVLGSVATGSTDPQRAGHIEIAEWHIPTGQTRRAVLHPNLHADDHNAPALIQRDDGRLLAMYSKHGGETTMRYRITTHPGDITQWEPEQTVDFGENAGVCYSNLFALQEGQKNTPRIYDFTRVHYRGQPGSNKPYWMYSDDNGASWTIGGKLIHVDDERPHRPYVRYGSNGRDTVHMLFTEGHPGGYRSTGIYHARLRDGAVCTTDGHAIRQLTDGPIQPHEATRIYEGTPQTRAWCADVNVASDGSPVAVYSVRLEPDEFTDLPKGDERAGRDLRYHYAWWNGQRWHTREVACAGRCLYAKQPDYASGICLDPGDPGVCYFSTNVDPATGQANESGRYQLFRMRVQPDQSNAAPEQLTDDHDADNIRPLALAGADSRARLLWVHGDYRAFQDYSTQIRGAVLDPLP